MKIHSYNEWSKLREIVVGTASHANWPGDDPVFSQESARTSWKETPVPSGPVPQWLVNEANEDLEGLCEILRQAGIAVHRPEPVDYVALGGMYGYCPRDRILIAGDTVVDVSMMYPCRDMEIWSLEAVWQKSSQNKYLTMPRDHTICDAANISRLNDKWLFLMSHSGNQAALDWLRQQFPQIEIESCNFYAGVHIDSTISPLRDGVALVNASRVRPDTLPKSLKGWDIIWVEDCVAQDFYQYPYASKWIGMNVLSLDPSTVIVDASQKEIINDLERKKFTVIPCTLRHSRTLGGGFHCVTLDTWREDA